MTRDLSGVHRLPGRQYDGEDVPLSPAELHARGQGQERVPEGRVFVPPRSAGGWGGACPSRRRAGRILFWPCSQARSCRRSGSPIPTTSAGSSRSSARWSSSCGSGGVTRSSRSRAAGSTARDGGRHEGAGCSEAPRAHGRAIPPDVGRDLEGQLDRAASALWLLDQMNNGELCFLTIRPTHLPCWVSAPAAENRARAS